MRLLLDVGNTAVKWAFAEGSVLVEQGRFVHAGQAFEVLAAQAWRGKAAPTAVVVANVAGAGMDDSVRRHAQTAWQLEPAFMRTARTEGGVTNAYETPGDLGVDRWVAMIAAHHDCRRGVCVIDCGTAITLDLLAASGQHQGGLILPGIDMLGQTLQAGTAGIEWEHAIPPGLPLARGTQAGVTGGAVYLVAAAIDRIVADMSAAAGEPVETWITGGDAARLLPVLQTPVSHRPDLVLQGLAILSDGEG